MAAPTPGSLASQGTIVFADDFGIASGGWYTGTSSSGSTATIRDGGYEITPARGEGILVDAPYGAPVAHLWIAADVQLPGGSSTGEGGVVCGWPDLAYAHYEFAVVSNGGWAILRAPKSSLHVAAQPILSGRLTSISPGATVHLVGVCSDRGSNGTDRITHLSMFVNGVLVGDVNDTLHDFPGTEWRAGLAAGQAAQGPLVTVRFTHFVLRDTDPESAAAVAARSWAPLYVLLGLFVIVFALVRVSRARRRRRERRAREAQAAATPPPVPATSAWGFPIQPDDPSPPAPPGKGGR